MMFRSSMSIVVTAFIVVTALAVGLWTASVLAAAPDGQEDICTSPAVFFCDNFEARALGTGDLSRTTYKNNGWSQSSLSSPLVINTEHFDGSNALDMVTPQNSASGGYMSASFPNNASFSTVYWRWYSKYSSNYVWSPVATKHNETFTCCFNGQFGGLGGAVQDNGWFNFTSNTGARTPVMTYIFANNNTNPYFTQNQNVLSQLNVNQWYCFEVRVTQNTCPTCTDGYVQGWIDGVQRIEFPNVNVTPISNPVTNGFFVASYWNCDANENCTSNPQYNHPTIHRYMDNLVGSTQRIGCLGSPSSAAPSPPTQPSVQ
jgi:hypothetical protein